MEMLGEGGSSANKLIIGGVRLGVLASESMDTIRGSHLIKDLNQGFFLGIFFFVAKVAFVRRKM
jgi:hypothetical protein